VSLGPAPAVARQNGARPALSVLVTGGAGFIGTHLVQALLARGDKVTVYDNLSVGKAGNVPGAAHLIVGDVCNAAAVEAAMSGQDAVVHLAARVAIRSSFDFAVEDTQVNVVGTAAVMRAAQRAGTVQRVVAASSMAIYADSPSAAPITESHPCAPLSPYGISKLAMEQLVHRMAHAAGIESAVLRFFNTYGPGQALSPYVGVVTIFAHALRDGKLPVIFGDGQQCRDFVHVADVVQALTLALDARGLTGETFNVGTGLATSVNSLYALVCQALGYATKASHAPAVAGELRYSIADIGRLQSHLGYVPRHLLEDALPAVVREIAAA
jgi:UDP-glucose 4-epimerase